MDARKLPTVVVSVVCLLIMGASCRRPVSTYGAKQRLMERTFDVDDEGVEVRRIMDRQLGIVCYETSRGAVSCVSLNPLSESEGPGGH